MTGTAGLRSHTQTGIPVSESLAGAAAGSVVVGAVVVGAAVVEVSVVVGGGVVVVVVAVVSVNATVSVTSSPLSETSGR